MTIAAPIFYTIAIIVSAFVTWRLYKGFQQMWDKAKTEKERKKVIITLIIVIVLGAAIFCAVKFSGLSKLMFPQYY